VQPAAVRPAPADLTATLGGSAAATRTEARADAATQVSRDLDRREVVAADEDAASADVSGPLAVPGSTPAFAQEDTAVVAEPADGAAELADVERGAQVALSGRTQDGYAEIVQDGVLAWIDGELVGSKPPPEETEEAATVAGPASGTATAAPRTTGVSGASCEGGSGVESGLTSNTVAVHRAVCAAFPGLVYGGVRPGDPGEHGSGRALDIMVTGSRGDAVAAFLQQHAGELGVDNIIWKQRIWFVGKPFSSWKGMEDRGSVTANHYDHVHVGTR
jgi:hypothetical protein